LPRCGPSRPASNSGFCRETLATALNSFEDNSVADQFVAAFDKIAQTSTLILDVRNNGGGNSGVGMRILGTLIDKPVSLEFWQTRHYKPIFRAWGRPIAMLSVPIGDVSPDPAHRYSKPIIMLSSPRTFSAAEDFLVAFDESGRGKIMGQPTPAAPGSLLTSSCLPPLMISANQN
jgi:carboxyl-terminal processing protease